MRADISLTREYENVTSTKTAWAPALCLLAALCLSKPVVAQEIEPFEFVPLPAGTNLILGYYVFGHGSEFHSDTTSSPLGSRSGSTTKNSNIDVNIAIARYVHYFDVGGMPAGVQILQPFGNISASFGGQSLGGQFGAGGTTLSAFIWPYVNTASKTNILLAGFLVPPDGTYHRSQIINVGDNRFRGTVEAGISQALGDSFAFDAAFDVQFYGDNANGFPGNTRISQDPTYRLQLWGTYRISPTITTSLGYEGFFGGVQTSNGFLNGNATKIQRIRANAAIFLTPRLQTMVEINHDLSVTGGYKQDIGVTGRILYVF